MTQILVIGASRGIGKHVVTQALQQNLGVRAMARSGGPQDHGVDWIKGDATNAKDVAQAVNGVDAVIMTLGIAEDLLLPFRPVTLFSSATKAVLTAMQDSGVRRLIVVTGIGTGDSASGLSFAERCLQRSLLGPPYRDKDLQEQMIRASDRDWTLVRPSILTHGRLTSGYKVLRDARDWRNGIISRADVAHFLLSVLKDPDWFGQAPVITR